jgi:Spy/CpxP family protein refolding chaperone
MKRTLLLVTAFLTVIGTTAWAQPPFISPPAPDHPMWHHLFPPELVMSNQKAVELTPQQQESIRAELKKAQARFFDLMWRLHAEGETMGSLLRQEPVNEEQALEQLNKILAIENEIKRTHFPLLVRIRNILSPEQRTQLDAIRKKSAHHRQGPPRPPEGPLPAGGPP